MARGRSDRYIKVQVILLHNTHDSMLVNCNLKRGPEKKAWVPFSLLHFADEAKIKKAPLDKVITVRMFEWKATQLSLKEVDDGESDD